MRRTNTLTKHFIIPTTTTTTNNNNNNNLFLLTRFNTMATTSATTSMMMKAVRLEGSTPTTAQGLKVRQVPIPKPNKGEVLVKNRVAGLNFIDTYLRNGLYPNPTGLLGGEGAGEIIQDEAQGGKLVGSRVAYIMGAGSYAEYTTVVADKCVVLPDDITYETAMGLMMNGLTAHYLLFDCARAKKDSWILVQAAGSGTSNMVAQIASRVIGANIVGTSSPGKIEAGYKRGGAKAMVDYSNTEGLALRLRSYTPNHVGFDAVIDGVGKNTWTVSLDSLRPRGVAVFYGNASGPIPPMDLLELSKRGSLSVVRPSLANYISPEELKQRTSDIFSWYRRGLLLIETDAEFPLEDVGKAHEYMEKGKTKGKVIIRIA
jgi:NADPH2:quinone reductase